MTSVLCWLMRWCGAEKTEAERLRDALEVSRRQRDALTEQLEEARGGRQLAVTAYDTLTEQLEDERVARTDERKLAVAARDALEEKFNEARDRAIRHATATAYARERVALNLAARCLKQAEKATALLKLEVAGHWPPRRRWIDARRGWMDVGARVDRKPRRR